MLLATDELYWGTAYPMYQEVLMVLIVFLSGDDGSSCCLPTMVVLVRLLATINSYAGSGGVLYIVTRIAFLSVLQATSAVARPSLLTTRH